MQVKWNTLYMYFPSECPNLKSNSLSHFGIILETMNRYRQYHVDTRDRYEVSTPTKSPSLENY